MGTAVNNHSPNCADAAGGPRTVAAAARITAATIGSRTSMHATVYLPRPLVAPADPRGWRRPGDHHPRREPPSAGRGRRPHASRHLSEPTPTWSWSGSSLRYSTPAWGAVEPPSCAGRVTAHVDAGIVSSSLSFVRSLGGTIGVAALRTVLGRLPAFQGRGRLDSSTEQTTGGVAELTAASFRVQQLYAESVARQTGAPPLDCKPPRRARPRPWHRAQADPTTARPSSDRTRSTRSSRRCLPGRSARLGLRAPRATLTATGN